MEGSRLFALVVLAIISGYSFVMSFFILIRKKKIYGIIAYLLDKIMVSRDQEKYSSVLERNGFTNFQFYGVLWLIIGILCLMSFFSGLNNL
jgi:hypothetical protein